MERFTRKYDKPIPFDENCTMYYVVSKNRTEAHVSINIVNKLGRLEDIEEELGCPLDVLFKALKQNKIYIEKYYCCGSGEEYQTKLFAHEMRLIFSEISEEELKNYDYFKNYANKWQFNFSYYNDDEEEEDCLINLCDYKKTWWIKEDKSE